MMITRLLWRLGLLRTDYGVSHRVALRSKHDVVQTSGGYAVSQSDARTLFRYARWCREHNCQWPCAKSLPLLYVASFYVSRISRHGDVTVGCQNISWAEMERLARRRGEYDQLTALSPYERNPEALDERLEERPCA